MRTRPAVTRNLLGWGRLTAIVLTLASCGGGGGGAPTGPTTAGQAVATGQARVVRLSNFRVRPQTGIYDRRNTKILFEQQTSDPDLTVGAFARLRLVASSEVEAGQTPPPPFLSVVQITRANLTGTTLRILMTVKLPKGRHRLVYSVARTATAEAVQGAQLPGEVTYDPGEFLIVLKSHPVVSALGPVRPFYAALSLALVLGLVATQVGGDPGRWIRGRRA